MIQVDLFRYKTGDDGTFGKLTISILNWTCFTVELPDRGNAPDISCIPLGVYIGKWLWSQKHGCFLFHLTGVPGRDVIEIHSANLAGDVAKGFVSQLLGCLAPGEAVATFQAGLAPAGSLDQEGVTESKVTLLQMHKLLGVSDDGKTAPDFELTIH